MSQSFHQSDNWEPCRQQYFRLHQHDKFLNELEEKLHFKSDKRIKFVGTVYDQELLKKIRENAYTENGASLKAAGYTCEGRAGGLEWNGAKAPKQADQYPRQMKTRWVKKKEGLHGS